MELYKEFSRTHIKQLVAMKAMQEHDTGFLKQFNMDDAVEVGAELVKLIYDWGNEPCPHPHVGILEYDRKRECEKCWQELLEASKEKQA